MSRLRIVVSVAVFILAFGVVGLQVGIAQTPDNDTAQAPEQTEPAGQPEATQPDQPTAQPDAEPDTAMNVQAEQMDMSADEPAGETAGDTVQTPVQRNPIPADTLQEPAGQQPDDTPAQQSQEGEPQPVDTTGAQPTGEPADQPTDTMSQQPAGETPGGVDTTAAVATDTTAQQPAETPPERTVNPDSPYEYVEFAEGEKPHVIMETTKGTIEIELWPDVAPRHCQSFVHLVESGFYDSLTFHRVVPGFIIQGGDPLGNGTGGPGYKLPPEFSDLPHEEGTVSAARLPSDRNSAGSQFFISLGRLQSLDGQYTIFGKVVEGLNVIHEIERVPVAAERPLTPVYILNAHMKSSGQEKAPSDTPGRER